MARHNDRGNILWTDKKRTLFGLPLSFTRYYLTDHQLITRTGFLSVQEDEIELYRITDKRIQQPLSQRIFGCGTVIILSRDEDTPEKHLVSIRHPQQVSNLIGACVREQQERLRIAGRDMVGAAFVNGGYDAPDDDDDDDLL
ncbi:MAG: PH domain-containing protein [Ruminococcus sp.]|nr:PH domain-containing protein [Ruminococcus callidus]